MTVPGSPALGPLQQAVVDASDAGTWSKARAEWDIVGSSIAPKRDGVCICGQRGLRNQFTISNRVTEEVLEPVGSSCINLFGRADLDDEATILTALSALKVEIDSGATIDTKDSFLSEQVFRHMHSERELSGWERDFMTKMYRRRTPMTPAQDVKWKAILSGKVIPYVQGHPKLL